MLLRAMRWLVILGIFFFPIAIWRGFIFPLTFSHSVFMFSVIEFLLFLFLFYSLRREEIVYRKSTLTLGLVLYIFIMVLTTINGFDFSLSFWSSYQGVPGIITWLHYFILFLIVSSIFTEEKDWKNIFRGIALSGFVLGIFSFLGIHGIDLGYLGFLTKGGSFMGSTSYSGAYLVLIFLFSFIGLCLEDKRIWKISYIVSMLAVFFSPDLFNFGIFNGTISFTEGLRNPMLLIGLARTSSLVLWMGLLGAIVLFWVNKVRNKKHVTIIIFSLLGVASAIYLYGFVSLINGAGKFNDFYVKNSGPMRPMVWQMAIEGIKERPLLGYGNGNFNYVYQNYLRTEMIHLENPPWFDNVDNFTLEELIEHGILGAVTMLGIFILIVAISLKFYTERRRFYFLLIPFIFFLNFLQLQTYFQTDSTLFLMLLLAAFLVSHQKSYTFKIPWPKKNTLLMVFILTATVFNFFIINPIKENGLIPLIKETKNREQRLLYDEKLNYLKINPAETLRQVSKKFTDETVANAKELQDAGYTEKVAEEYKVYLKIYEKYLPRYSGLHKYLFEYGNLINVAYVFGVDELKRGEELARKSLEISQKYPYAYWVLAVNLYYQGRTAESLEYAKKAYDLDPTLQTSKDVYETLKGNARYPNLKKQFFYFSDIPS